MSQTLEGWEGGRISSCPPEIKITNSLLVAESQVGPDSLEASGDNQWDVHTCTCGSMVEFFSQDGGCLGFESYF